MNSQDIGVIVVAYGPSARTKRAVRRARQLVGPARSVSVVPASAFASQSCGGLSVDVVSVPGSEGLIEVLSERADEAILLLHDDVLITRNGLRAMASTLEGSVRYVVPHTNDIGMDHFAGSTPSIDRVAASALDSRAAGLATQSVITVRPVCIVARREDMMALTERHLVEPNLRIDDVDLGFVAAPVMAAHDGACVSQLGPPRLAADRPLLVAAMIVRDEEAMLPALLESIEPLVDRIEICDTGSVDRTMDIARDAGANIIQREWRDDFGWARNQVLEECRDAEYVLLVDADDRVVCPDPIAMRRYLATYNAEYPAFSILISSPGDSGGSAIRSVRIARADRVAFEGAVHELSIWRDRPEDGAIRASSLDLLSILHIGYSLELSSIKDKAGRNLRIAKKAFERERDFKSTIEYARSLIGAELDLVLAGELLEDAFSLADDAPPATRAYVSALLAAHRLEFQGPEEGLALARSALEAVPSDAMLLAVVARATDKLGRPEELVLVADEVASRPSVAPLFDAPSDRTLFDEAVVVARACTGDTGTARHDLVKLLRNGGFDRWNDLLDAIRDWTEVGEWLEPILAEHPHAALVPWLKSTANPAEAADICARMAEAGVVTPEIAMLGTISALVSGQLSAIDALAPHLAALEQPKLDRLVLEATRRGHREAATKLETVQPLSTSRT